jgi:hypothetical protein
LLPCAAGINANFGFAIVFSFVCLVFLFYELHQLNT